VKEERKKKLNTARATLHDRREMRAFLKQTPFRGTEDKRTPIPSRGRIFVFFFLLSHLAFHAKNLAPGVRAIERTGRSLGCKRANLTGRHEAREIRREEMEAKED
jgi:hypothetical protein